MAKKKKAPEGAPMQCKYSNTSRIKQQIEAIFLSGRRITAKELNAITGGNDARKTISVLRKKEGWGIKDKWINSPNRCKLYWLEIDVRQLELAFIPEGGVE